MLFWIILTEILMGNVVKAAILFSVLINTNVQGTPIKVNRTKLTQKVGERSKQGSVIVLFQEKKQISLAESIN